MTTRIEKINNNKTKKLIKDYLNVDSNYDYKTYLRKYMPYLIRCNNDNNYYILNRDYEYIGLNTKYIEYDVKEQFYLFNDGTKPWDKVQNLFKVFYEYKKIIKEKSLKECLNQNEITEKIISLNELNIEP
jgi:hypothetical protein